MSKRGLGLWLTGLFLALAALPAAARDHHVAATGTAAARAPDGSAAAPWPSLAEALKSGRLQGGDRLLLAPGEHGRLAIGGQSFDTPLLITSAPGGQAHADAIAVRKSQGITLQNLAVWPRTPPGKDAKSVLVEADANSARIRFEQLDIRGGPDGLNYLSWDLNTWREVWTSRGVYLNGPDQVLQNSTISGISNAIVAKGARVQVIGNEIRGFSRDAMRGLGPDEVFRGNLVRDCVKIDNNHDDGFQSWAPGTKQNRSPLRNLTVEGNTILEWTGPSDHPLRCRLQGIVLFNGPYENTRIVNNLVAISAFHGITIYSGTGNQVINNTVLNIRGGGKTWIRQRGSGPGGVYANNVAATLKFDKTVGKESRNVLARNLAQMFENPAKLDFRPRKGGPLIDAADPAFAPKQDLRATPRPQGRGPDLGAFERQ